MRLAGFLALALFAPALAFAADLININTADATLLDSLPHIGAATAQKIIAYREANGPYTTIEDIKKASTYISDSYYADIAPLITVGDAAAPAAAVASTTEPQTAGRAAAYVPPPSAIAIEVTGDDAAVLNVPLKLAARVTGKSGAVDSAAQISWSFGDGSRGEGTEVEKVYRYAGTYLVTATAQDGSARARDEIVVTVKAAAPRIASVTAEGIMLANDASDRLDLSGWRLLADTGSFRIPEGTTILPNASVLFPFTIMNLPVAFSAVLAYPDGTLAALSAAPVVQADTQVLQPLAPEPGLNEVQTVESVVATTISGTAHDDQAVRAPAAATELAAAGAALPPVPPEATQDTGSRGTNGLLRSPWTLGFLGVVALAGGAFILL